MQLLADAIVAGYNLIVPCAFLHIEILHPHDFVIDARSGEIDVVGVVNEGAIGAHLLDDVPHLLHDGVVEEERRIINKNHRSRHCVDGSTEIVEHGALAIRQTHRSHLVGTFVVLEEQFAAFAQDFIVGEHPVPSLGEAVEIGLVHWCRLVFEGEHFIFEQGEELIMEQQECEFLYFGIDIALYDLRAGFDAAVEHIYRAGHCVHLLFREKCLERRDAECMVADILHDFTTESGFSGTIGTDYSDNSRIGEF